MAWLCLISAGFADGSIAFNGTTSKLENTGADVLNSSSVVSVGVWVFAVGKGESDLGRIFVLDETEGSADWKVFHHTSDNVLRIQKGSGAVGTRGDWTFPATDGQWNRIAIKHNWSTDAAPAVQVNGAGVTVTEVAAPVGIQDAPATGYVVGNNTGQTRTWDGRMAYLQVWNADVSFANINAALLSPGSVTANLRLYLPMTTSTDINDGSGNGFNGTGTALANGVDGPALGRPTYYYQQQSQRQRKALAMFGVASVTPWGLSP